MVAPTGKHLIIPDSEEMQELGRRLASVCPHAVKIYLQGDLGAGKTTLVRGFLRGLGYQGKVKSPTYTLVEPYQLEQRRICHFDLYRINDPDELEAIGIRDYFDNETTCLVEWPERAGGVLETADLYLSLQVVESGRSVELQAISEQGGEILTRLSWWGKKFL